MSTATSERMKLWTSIKVIAFHVQWEIRDCIAGMLQDLARWIAP